MGFIALTFSKREAWLTICQAEQQQGAPLPSPLCPPVQADAPSHSCTIEAALLHATSEPVTRCKRGHLLCPLCHDAVQLLRHKVHHTALQRVAAAMQGSPHRSALRLHVGRKAYTSSRCHKVALQACAGWHCMQQLRDHVCGGQLEQQVELSVDHAKMRPARTVGTGEPCCILRTVLTLLLGVLGLQRCKHLSNLLLCNVSNTLQSAP